LSLFTLTEDQLEFAAMTKQFCDKRIRPVARKLDNEGIPEEFLSELSELGYLGCSIPEEYGGMGIDNIALSLMVEEFAKASGGVATLVAAHLGLGCKSLEMYGNDKQKSTYLPKMAKGDITSFCLTEPNAGTDVFSIEAKAQAQGDSYILNGEKHFITSADIAKYFVVFCKTEKGPSAFIVERDAEGLSVGPHEKKLGQKASNACSVCFLDVKVPAENILGQMGKGLRIALSVLDFGRLGVAALALGIAEQAFVEAVDFAQNRVQFGKTIASFQATQFKFADMRTEIDAARYLFYYALGLSVEGKRFSVPAAEAKLKASEVASFVADQNIQMHGGYGYTEDYNAERLWRDGRITRIYEGTSEAMRTIIGGQFRVKKEG
jgi:alkylation response protein AidB-like acyl-CoA dehydrogenase